MDTHKGMAEDGDLSAFRKFIEESLDVAGLGDSAHRVPPDSMSDLMRYNLALADHRAFQRDIRQAWNALHREKPSQTYWGFRLTPLQLETRVIVQEMILARLQKRFSSTPTEDELRSMIAYTMSLSWLILGALQDKYAPPGHDSDINLNDIEF